MRVIIMSRPARLAFAFLVTAGMATAQEPPPRPVPAPRTPPAAVPRPTPPPPLALWEPAWERQWLEQQLHWEQARLRQQAGREDVAGLVQQQSPEDSLYRAARQVLNAGEYRRAAELFGSFGERYPASRNAGAAMYWQAFALYRVGADAELRQALAVLDQQRQRHPAAAAAADAQALRTRLLGALAARGDADAARRVREGAAQGLDTCDREDMEVRAEALSALVRADPSSAEAVIRRTLARRDECSVPLRRRALVLLSQDGAERNLPLLLEAARNDPDASVRSDALNRIARLSGDAPVRALEQIITTSTDDRALRSAIQALRNSGHADVARILRSVIERENLSDAVRAEAVRSMARRPTSITVRPTAVELLAGQVVQEVTPSPFRVTAGTDLAEADAVFLRAQYGRATSRTVKTAILETLAAAGGTANDAWLMGIVRNATEDMIFRTSALGRLRRADVPVAELGRLYDELTERRLRSTIITYLGARAEDAATDKLIAIARSGTDPQLRREAISALSRKRDERTTRLLLEIIER
jgi:hypothetical protein